MKFTSFKSQFNSPVHRAAGLLGAALALAGCAHGPPEPEGSTSPLPPLARTGGLLETGAAFIGVTSEQLQQIHATASSVAAKVVDEQHRDFLIPCKPASNKAAD